jgi:hypothetical protein
MRAALADALALGAACRPPSTEGDGSSRKEVVINSGQGTQYVQAFPRQTSGSFLMWA